MTGDSCETMYMQLITLGFVCPCDTEGNSCNEECVTFLANKCAIKAREE